MISHTPTIMNATAPQLLSSERVNQLLDRHILQSFLPYDCFSSNESTYCSSVYFTLLCSVFSPRKLQARKLLACLRSAFPLPLLKQLLLLLRVLIMLTKKKHLLPVSLRSFFLFLFEATSYYWWKWQLRFTRGNTEKVSAFHPKSVQRVEI
jgi:hypothetical protein